MTREETAKWLESLKSEIGKSEHRALWHYAEAIDMAIEALSADAVQRWRTGKPTESGKYMVTLDGWRHKYTVIMHYGKPLMPSRKVKGMCWYVSDSEWNDEDILAWMPLPEPYKGGDSEGERADGTDAD